MAAARPRGFTDGAKLPFLKNGKAHTVAAHGALRQIQNAIQRVIPSVCRQADSRQCNFAQGAGSVLMVYWVHGDASNGSDLM